MTAGLGDSINERGTELFAVQLVFLVVGWIFALLRAYVKVFMIKVTIDDWLMFLAVLLYTVYGTIALLGIVYGGTGKHTSQLTPQGAAFALKAWYLCEVLYSPLAATIRTSIAFFLLRIATLKVHRTVIYVNLVVIWVLSTVYFFIMLFQCDPPSYFWEQVLGASGHCLDPRLVPDATIAHSAISAVSDWSLALLPLWMLWNVRLNRRTKASVGILLGMGGVAGVALIIRIPYVRFLAISADFLYETIDVALWSVLEPSLGIIAGCTATLRPLFSGLGFGPSSTRRYGSKPKSGNSSRPVCGGSRHTQKLGDGPAHLSKSLGRSEENSADSDIELNRPAQTHGDTSVEVSSPTPTWDVESGAHQGWALPQSAVHIHTSIDVSSQQRQSSHSSSERIFPLQG